MENLIKHVKKKLKVFSVQLCVWVLMRRREKGKERQEGWVCKAEDSGSVKVGEMDLNS